VNRIGRRVITCIAALAVICNLLGQQRVRFDPHSGLASDIAPCLESAKDRDRGEPLGSPLSRSLA
jgi:hypothetical protein